MLPNIFLFRKKIKKTLEPCCNKKTINSGAYIYKNCYRFLENIYDKYEL